MHIETSQALAVAGSIIAFLVGVIVLSIRSTLDRIEKILDKNELHHEDIFHRLVETEKKLSGLCADHNRVMQGGGHGNKKL